MSEFRSKTSTSLSRLAGERITAQTYGSQIPISRGIRLVEGQLLFSTPISQVVKTTRTRYSASQERQYIYSSGYDVTTGKWVDKTEIDTSAVSDIPPDQITNEVVGLMVDCAIGFGAPLNSDVEARILELRAGNSVIYSNYGGKQTSIAGKYAVYTGTETQLPDPLLERILGKDSVPAYRGEIYIVFEELDLNQFGGVFPTISALIADETTSVVNSDSYGGSNTIRGNCIAVDWSREVIFAANIPNGSGNVGYVFDRYNPNSFLYIGSIVTDEIFGGASNPLSLIEEFKLLLTTAIGANNSIPISCYDMDTGKLANKFGLQNSNTDFSNSSFVNAVFIETQVVETDNGHIAFALIGGILGGVGLLKVEEDGQLIYQGHDNAYGRMKVTCRGPRYRNKSFIFTCTDTTIYCFVVGSSTFSRDLDSNGDLNVPNKRLYLDGVEDANYWFHLGDDWEIRAIHYYAPEDVLLVLAVENGIHYFLKINMEGRVKLQVVIPNAGSIGRARRLSNLDQGTIGVYANRQGMWRINIRSGVATDIGVGPHLSDDTWFWDSRTNRFTGEPIFGDGTLTWVQASGTLVGRLPLATLIEETAAYVGIDDASVSVDIAIDNVVDGFCLKTRTDWRRMMKTWGEAFAFNIIEGGDGFSFRKRGSVLDDGTFDFELNVEDIATIQATDFPRNADDPFTNASIISNIRPDSEIADYVEMHYSDFNYDFHENVYYTGRARLPNQLYIPGDALNINIPELILRTVEVAQLCAQLLFDDMTAKVTHALRLPSRYANAQPADTLFLTLGDYSYKIKLTNVTYHQDFSVSAFGVDFWSDIEPITEYGAEEPVGRIPRIVSDSKSEVLILDIPTLQASDYSMSGLEITMYAGASGVGQEGWQKAAIASSITGASNFIPIVEITSELYSGFLLSGISKSIYASEEIQDEETEFQFYLKTGDPSILRTLTVNGWLGKSSRSVAIVGFPGAWEILAIREFEADLDNDRLFTCRGLLRGLRDTAMHGTHAPGAQILFPSLNRAMKRISEPVAKLGTPMYYIAIGEGYNITEAIRQRVILGAEAQRPMSVVAYQAHEAAGNITLSWVRQSALSIAFPEVGDIEDPINEFDNEVYELKIKNGPGGVVVRTVTINDNTEYVYTAANILADGFVSPLSRLAFQVTQISEAFGNGRTTERNVIVERS